MAITTTPIVRNAPIARNGANQNQTIQLQVQNPNDSIVNEMGEINMQPEVPAMTQVIASAAGGGALSKTVYFLNEDIFNATPTNNGSGAGSITNTYGDGWVTTGKGGGYNNLAKALAPQNGIKCYGFTLQFITISTGAQSGAALATANPSWIMANLVGMAQIPKGFVLSAGARNTQYLAGEMTVRMVFYLNSLCQMSYVVPADTQSTLTVLTKPF